MIKINKRIEYGLISLLHISETKDQQLLVTCREISDHYHIPPDILGKVLQALARASIVDSIQGVKGGYRLRKDLEDIVFGDVIEALEGPIHLTPCTCESYVCDIEPHCNIKEPMFHFQDQLLKFVYSVSLASFQRKDLLHKSEVLKPNSVT